MPKSGVIWERFGRHSGKTTYKEPAEALAEAQEHAANDLPETRQAGVSCAGGWEIWIEG